MLTSAAILGLKAQADPLRLALYSLYIVQI